MTRRWFGIALAAVLPTVALSGGTAFAAPDQPVGVSVVVTDLGAQKYLAPQPGMSWQRGSAPAGPTITVDTTRRYQEITGFGASFTDSSAWLVGTKLDASQRDAVMRDLFSDQGIGLSFLRQPMGASDFAVKGNYSYDDMPPGKTDPTLAHFSIDHDRAYIIPLLLQARRINPHLTVMATPWSPPGWMKTSDSMIGGTLRPEAYQPLADYFAKFIEDYAAAGVPIRYITPQNEPLFIPGGYPGMFLSAAQADDLIKNHLGPTLRAHHLPTGILAYDHNWDAISYPETMYADPDAAGYVAGTAWHCYGGDVITQAVSHNNYPNKPAFHTECSGGDMGGRRAGGLRRRAGPGHRHHPHLGQGDHPLEHGAGREQRADQRRLRHLPRRGDGHQGRERQVGVQQDRRLLGPRPGEQVRAPRRSARRVQLLRQRRREGCRVRQPRRRERAGRVQHRNQPPDLRSAVG